MVPQSFTVNHTITAADGVKTVVEGQGWIELSYKLSSQAPGAKNILAVGKGTTGILVEPGDHGSILVAPTTQVKIHTDSSSGESAEWSFVITPLPVGDLLSLVQDIRTLLQMLACGTYDPDTVRDVLRRGG